MISAFSSIPLLFKWKVVLWCCPPEVSSRSFELEKERRWPGDSRRDHPADLDPWSRRGINRRSSSMKTNNLQGMEEKAAAGETEEDLSTGPKCGVVLRVPGSIE